MTSEGDKVGIDLKAFVEAVQGEFRRLNARFDDLTSPSKPKSSRRRLVEEGDDEESEGSADSSRKGRRGERRQENHVGSIKMKIPSFQGKSDPDLYMEWERRVEHVFDCHSYPEEKKVKLAAVEFADYASIWWDQLKISRRRCGERPVESWEEMKKIM